MTEYVPKLKSFFVDPRKLLLDPNNPRFVSSNEERIPDSRIADPAVISATASRMYPSGKGESDQYRITELVHSITKNGWQPIDSIFVKSYGDQDCYLVLEGNRRVSAIQKLLNDERLDKNLRNDLTEIEVMEVLGESDPEIFERQISYLLGVRHHGALKTWSPFAQARNIFECYMERAKLGSEDDFFWDKNIGEEVADALSIRLTGPRSVEERLSVFRAMLSVARLPGVGPENMKDHYYSLFSELLAKKKQAIGKYIVQDNSSFSLTEESAQKMENLCRFSQPQRKDAPINNPTEWRPLNEILKDEEEDKRAENLERVESGEQPSVVWAQRSEELKKVEWAIWLDKVRAVFGRVLVNQIDPEDTDALETVKQLVDLLEKLDSK